MRCASQIAATQSTDNTVIVPAGCLDEIQIKLQCKAPLESIYYNLSLQNYLQHNEIITSVVSEPSDGTGGGVNNINTANQFLKCRISGGNLNTYERI